MTQALAVRHDDMPLEKLGNVFVQSGFFKDIKSAQQAVVKVLAGRELGIGPFSSQTSLHIIEGKPVLSANLLAAAVKRSGKYNYRIKRLDETGCSITFLERNGDKWEEVGVSEFTQKDAAAAGLAGKQNWTRYAKAMYFARAISQGQRWYAPDIFSGSPVYTPDEMDMEVNADGEAVAAPVVAPAVVDPEVVPHAPAPPSPIEAALDAPSPALLKKVWARAKALNIDADSVKAFSVSKLGKASSKEWTVSDCDAVLDWIGERIFGGDDDAA